MTHDKPEISIVGCTCGQAKIKFVIPVGGMGSKKVRGLLEAIRNLLSSKK